MENVVETEHLIQRLTEIEDLANDILTDKEEIVNLDRLRNGNREALRAMSKPQFSDEKSWVCLNNTFIKLSKATVQKIIFTDQTKLNAKIKSLRDGMKDKVSQLNEAEGKDPEISKWKLETLSKDELKAVKY
ncbi:p53 and DNA damage-regulated protein 1 [Chamberlinius hualienensis]